MNIHQWWGLRHWSNKIHLTDDELFYQWWIHHWNQWGSSYWWIHHRWLLRRWINSSMNELPAALSEHMECVQGQSCPQRINHCLGAAFASKQKLLQQAMLDENISKMNLIGFNDEFIIDELIHHRYINMMNSHIDNEVIIDSPYWCFHQWDSFYWCFSPVMNSSSMINMLIID